MKATFLLMALAVTVAGCTSGSKDADAITGSSELHASPSSLPFEHVGTIGETVCVLAQITLVCPVYGDSEGARFEFACPEGSPVPLEANLSWASSGPLPFRMSASFWYGSADDPQTDMDSWSSTTSPMSIVHDLRPYANETLTWLGIDGYGEARIPATNLGVLASTRTPFELVGTVSCEV